MKDEKKESQNPEPCDGIGSRRCTSWQDFFDLVDQIGVPDDFLSDRGDAPPQKR
jgi:hypothetical protein